MEGSSGSIPPFVALKARHGMPWRARTKFATNTALTGVVMLCKCQTPHVVLRGRSAAHVMAWTRVAQSYPKQLAVEIASAMVNKAGWNRRNMHSNKMPLSASIARLPPAMSGLQGQEGGVQLFSLSPTNIPKPGGQGLVRITDWSRSSAEFSSDLTRVSDEYKSEPKSRAANAGARS